MNRLPNSLREWLQDPTVKVIGGNMARRLEKLEQRLYRTLQDIRDAPGQKEVLQYIRRYGKLERRYTELTGCSFTPGRGNESIQDYTP